MSRKIVRSLRLNDQLLYHDVQINTSDVVGLSTATTVDSTLLTGVICLSSVVVGGVVRMSSGVAMLAQADTYSNSNWVGIAIEKPGDTCCTIRFPSLSSATYSTLVPGSQYFLSDSTAGSVTTVIATANNSLIVPVGTAFTSQILLIINGDRIIRRS